MNLLIYLELCLQKFRVIADSWETDALCNYKVLEVQL